MPIISAASAVIEDTVTGPVTISVEDGRITEIAHGTDGVARADLHLDDGLLTAGMIDLQLNGAFGIDCISADSHEWGQLAQALLSTGVTAFQPTFITAPLEEQLAGVRRAATARRALETRGCGARILGVHLEGPFLSPLRSGMHPVAFLQEPTAVAVRQLLGDPTVREMVTTVTLAPELPGGLEAVGALVSAGIRVWIGHSDATADVMRAAVEAGASGVTHVFNAQRGLTHRETGVAGTALADDRLTVGLIADLHHVAAPVCQIVIRAAPGRVALVTDAMAAMGMDPGTYELGGVQVSLGPDGSAPRLASGRLAGSALRLDQAVRNMVGLGLDVPTVLGAVTRVPADALDRHDLGRLVVGAAADLVWWSEDLTVRRVWVRGHAASVVAT